jgi:transcriptional regulator with XRE-family HTH domain
MDLSKEVKMLRKSLEKKVEAPKLTERYGGLIKRARTHYNLTQESLSHGICSISYLSKLENNQIAADPTTLKALAERLELEDIDADGTSLSEHLLSEAMTAYFYESNADLKAILSNPMLTRAPTTSQLIQLLSAILESDLAQTESLIEELTLVFRSMRFDESVIFIIAQMADAFNKHRYQRILELASVLDGFYLKNRVWLFMYHFLAYQAAMFLERKNVGNYHLHHAKHYLEKHNHPHYQNLVILYERYFLNHENPWLVYKIYTNDENFLIPDRYQNLNALIQLENAYLLNRAFPEIEINHYVKDEWYYRLNVFMATHMNYDAGDIFKEASHRMLPFMSLYQLSKIKRPDERFRRLREQVIPQLIRHEEVWPLRQAISEAMDYLIKSSRYKEAVALDTKLKKTLTTFGLSL